MARNSKNINMIEGPIFWKIIKFVLPLALTGLLQRLYNTADVIVVGRWAGEIPLAAVGASGSLTTLMLDLFIGLSAGISVVLGHALGAGDKERVRKAVHTAMFIAIFGGAIISVIGIVFAEPLLRLIEVPDEVMPQAKLYMQISFSGKVPVLVYTFSSAIVRAKGDTKRPLYIVTISGIINVVLNLFFVCVCKMQAEGVAIATVISQIYTAVSMIILLRKEEGELKLSLRKLCLHKGVFGEVLKIGIPSAIQHSVFSLSNVVVQSSVNSFGSAAVIAGNTAAANLCGLFYICFNAFYSTSIAFVSQNVGAKKHERVNKIVGACSVGVLIFGVITCLIAFFGGELLLKIYIPDNPAAMESGLMRLRIVGCSYTLLGVMSTMNGALRGMGYSVSNMILNIFGTCFIRFLWIVTVFNKTRNFLTLYLAYPVSWGVAFICLGTLYIFAYKQLKKKMLAETAV